MKKCKLNLKLSKLELNKKKERELRKERDLDLRENRPDRKNMRLCCREKLRRRKKQKKRNSRRKERKSSKRKLLRLRKQLKKQDTINLRLKRRNNSLRVMPKQKRLKRLLRRLLKILKRLKLKKRRFKRPKKKFREKFSTPRLLLLRVRPLKLLLNQESRLPNKEWKNSRRSKRLLKLEPIKKSNSRKIELRLNKNNWLLELRRTKKDSLTWLRNKKKDRKLSMKLPLKPISKPFLPESWLLKDKKLTIEEDLRLEEHSSLLNSPTSGSMDQLVSPWPK